jgi:AcrR family transcriptional regulator
MSWPKRLAWPGGTLYNQFASKEEIFREMLLRVSSQLEDAFLPGIESQGNVDVLRLVAQMILDLHKHPEYPGVLRMVVADSRQFPLKPRVRSQIRLTTSRDASSPRAPR